MSVNWSEIVNMQAVVEWLVSSGLRMALIVAGALATIWLASYITRRVEKAFDDNDPSTMNEREKQAATLGKVIRNVVRILVWGVALMMLLRELHIDIGPILAGVGVEGLAVELLLLPVTRAGEHEIRFRPVPIVGDLEVVVREVRQANTARGQDGQGRMRERAAVARGPVGFNKLQVVKCLPPDSYFNILNSLINIQYSRLNLTPDL